MSICSVMLKNNKDKGKQYVRAKAHVKRFKSNDSTQASQRNPGIYTYRKHT